MAFSLRSKSTTLKCFTHFTTKIALLKFEASKEGVVKLSYNQYVHFQHDVSSL